MAKVRLTMCVLVLVSFAGVGCSSSESKEGACGDGEVLTGDDGQVACLYSAELIEEGFVCPSDFGTRWDLEGGGAVCTGTDQLPPGVAEDLIELGYREEPNSGWELLPPSNNENNNVEPNNVEPNNVEPTNNNVEPNNVTSPVGTPVTFRVELVTDIPENYWVQTSDQRGFVGWVRLVDDRYSLSAPCDIGVCGTDPMTNTCTPPIAERFVNEAYSGEIEWEWDGVLRDNMPSSCYAEEAAAAGQYTVEFCIARQLLQTGQAGEWIDPDTTTCREMSFDHPTTPEVVWNADFGG